MNENVYLYTLINKSFWEENKFFHLYYKTISNLFLSYYVYKHNLVYLFIITIKWYFNL